MLSFDHMDHQIYTRVFTGGDEKIIEFEGNMGSPNPKMLTNCKKFNSLIPCCHSVYLKQSSRAF